MRVTDDGTYAENLKSWRLAQNRNRKLLFSALIGTARNELCRIQNLDGTGSIVSRDVLGSVYRWAVWEPVMLIGSLMRLAPVISVPVVWGYVLGLHLAIAVLTILI